MQLQIQYCTTTDGVSIAYYVRGTGPALVATITSWESIRFDSDEVLGRDYYDELARYSRLVRYERRGIGLSAKVQAYKLQERGLDTVEANLKLGFPMDLRDYGVGAQMLCDLGLKKIRLLTNNPKKLVGLQGYGLEVIEQLPIRVKPNPHNARYLKTKRERMGHLL